jgi:hypothetical protein
VYRDQLRRYRQSKVQADERGGKFEVELEVQNLKGTVGELSSGVTVVGVKEVLKCYFNSGLG